MTPLVPTLLMVLAGPARGEPVVSAPAPVEVLELSEKTRRRLEWEAAWDRLVAAVLARALDRLVYIDMAPTPGAGAPEGPPGPPPSGGPPGPPPSGGPPGPLPPGQPPGRPR